MERGIVFSLILLLLGVAAILSGAKSGEAVRDARSDRLEAVATEPAPAPGRDPRAAHRLPTIVVTPQMTYETPAGLGGATAVDTTAARVPSAPDGRVVASAGARLGHVMPYYAFGGTARAGKE